MSNKAVANLMADVASSSDDESYNVLAFPDEVELSSGSAVSPDVLEPIFTNSPLFSDIYIDSRRGSTACVAIVTPAPSQPVMLSKILDRVYCKNRSQVHSLFSSHVS
jgi:hypothetical protein